jgi:septation ring formation regulator EzrA
MCSAASNNGTPNSGADDLNALKLKNQQLQEELKRLRSSFLAKEVDLAAMRKDEPEIAQLLQNNRAWVQNKLVSITIAGP